MTKKSKSDQIVDEPVRDLGRDISNEVRVRRSARAESHEILEEKSSSKPDIANITGKVVFVNLSDGMKYENGVLRSTSPNDDVYLSKQSISDGVISAPQQSKEKFLSLNLKLEKLEEFAKRNAGEGVAKFARELFPELTALESAQQKPSIDAPLPTAAPEKYEGLRGPEAPPDFIRRVYEPWLGKGLTRAHLRAIDRPLWQALYNWLRTNEMPGDIDLPTRTQAADRWVSRIDSGELPEDSLRNARNLLASKQRRKNEKHK